MANAFVRKLDSLERLSKVERQTLVEISKNVEKAGARRPILGEGEVARGAHVILSGLACRYRILEDGSRQITDFLVPGDVCEGRDMVGPDAGYCISALSPCNYLHLDRQALDQVMEKHPRIARALRSLSVMNEGILREWVANVGRRPAVRRVAHLMSELCFRLHSSENAKASSCALPLTQTDLADATALSPVHINRVLGRLREKRLVGLQRRSIIVKDTDGLMAFAEFNSAYLQHRPPAA
ncbi:MAG: Crp/Fnr family transcriptional regulator [Rhodospirillaceae bacterium]